MHIAIAGYRMEDWYTGCTSDQVDVWDFVFLIKLGWLDYGVFDDWHHRPCIFLTADSALPRLKLTFRRFFLLEASGVNKRSAATC